jgi:hypothetical protein
VSDLTCCLDLIELAYNLRSCRRMQTSQSKSMLKTIVKAVKTDGDYSAYLIPYSKQAPLNIKIAGIRYRQGDVCGSFCESAATNDM